MAESPEETPENIVDEVEAAAQSGGENTGAEAAGTAEAAPTAPAEAAPAAPAGATRRERLEQRRSARRTSRGRTSPEERAAERQAKREHNAAERRRYRARTKAKQSEVRKSKPAPEPDHAPEHGPGRAKVRQGIVVSDKADKTITVRIDVVRRHKRYHKIMRTSIKLHAHDERNDAGAGDTVRVQECRPMSRSKRWRLIEVVERAK
jgi:small subunit ribosomal protein S17